MTAAELPDPVSGSGGIPPVAAPVTAPRGRMPDDGVWLRRAHAELPDLLAQTATLVDVASGTTLTAGVEEVCTRVGALLAEAGFAISRPATDTAVPGLDAVREFGAGPRITIVGHADTVWNDAEHAQGFRDAGEHAFGDGIGDMKGALVAAVAAVRWVGEYATAGRMRLVLVTDEQLGSPGSRAWLDEVAADTDICLGLEASGPLDDVVVSRGAVGAYVVRVAGRAAHVTEPGGVSALDPLVEIAAALPGISADREAAGAGQLRAGILRAGVARQVLPADGELHIDLRAPDESAAAVLDDRLRALVAAVSARAVATVSLTGGVTRPAFPIERSGALYEIAREVSARAGVELGARRERGGSDASFFAAAGVPTLDGLGPVCIGNCSPNEHIVVASLARRAALIAALTATGLSGAIPASARESGA